MVHIHLCLEETFGCTIPLPNQAQARPTRQRSLPVADGRLYEGRKPC